MDATTVRARPMVTSDPSLPVALLPPAPLRKLLSSATLAGSSSTSNPERLAALGLVHPRIYNLSTVPKNTERQGDDQIVS